MWLLFSVLTFVVVGIAGQDSDGVFVVETNPMVELPEQPTVVIAQGIVTGSRSSDGSYAEFFGIPYADATSGSNRFKAPNPPPLFEDTFVADRKNIKCVRALGVGYEGTEDCLVADVYTTTLDSTKQLPVMVWVKGKEFDKINEHELTFRNFLDKDVVVVSLNYRESVLGFLCLGTETAPGNAGLKDIIAGLKWVQDNIAQFGGNPNDITLVGHGSGAAAVDLVTMSPMANGLINKAIAQSGNALSPWAVSRDNLKYAIHVAEALGHVITDIEDLSTIFTRTSVAALMGVINELDLTDNALAFAPCIERDDLEGVEAFLVKSPYESLLAGEFLPIPLIIGFVDNEGTIRSEEAVEDNWLSKMDESFHEFMPTDLEFSTAQEQTQIAQNIRSQYFQNNPIDLNHVQNYVDYHGDTMILVAALREVRLRVFASNSPVFVYQFSYKGTLGEPFVGPLSVDGAAHSEELAYMLFDTDDEQTPVRDLVIGDILVERWTNFAKDNIPLSETSQVLWRPFTSIQAFFLRFLDSNEVTDEATLEVLLQNPHPETLRFWDDIYAEHFLDAEAKWDWDERTEEDEATGGEGSSEEGSGDENSSGQGDSEESSGEEGNGEEIGGGDDGSSEEGSDEDENSVEAVTDSASAACGYTLSIITIFAIINKFHSHQMLL